MARTGPKPMKDREQKRMAVSIALPRKDLDFIDECAKELRISRSQFIHNVLKNGMEDAVLMKKVGFFKVVGKVRDLMDRREKQLKMPF